MPKSLEAKISDVIEARDAVIAEIDAQIAELQAKKAELLAGRNDTKPPSKSKGGRGRRASVNDRELTKLVKQGWTAKRLAAHFGVSTQTIQNRKAKLGLTKPRKRKKKAKKNTGRTKR